MGLDLSGNGSSETMYDEGDRNGGNERSGVHRYSWLVVLPAQVDDTCSYDEN